MSSSAVDPPRDLTLRPLGLRRGHQAGQAWRPPLRARFHLAAMVDRLGLVERGDATDYADRSD